MTNCNSLYWEKKANNETINPWWLPKEIGVTLLGKEEEILRKYDEMEDIKKLIKIVRDGGRRNCD